MRERGVEMEEVKKIHFLIHPFYSATIGFDAETIQSQLRRNALPSVPATYQINFLETELDLKRIEKTLARGYGKLIRRVKKSSGEILVYEPAETTNKRVLRLEKYARDELGEEAKGKLFFVKNFDDLGELRRVLEKIQKFAGKVNPARIQLEGHGEIAMKDYACVHSGLRNLAKVIGDSELMSHASHIPSKEAAPKIVGQSRVRINYAATEQLAGKERFVRKHTQRAPRKKTLKPLRKRSRQHVR